MKISIVYPEQFNMFYFHLANAFKDCLEQLNHEVKIIHNVLSESDLEFNLCPLHYGLFEKKKKIYLMVQMEQFPTQFCSNGWQQHKWNMTKSFLHLYDTVWDTYYEFHKELYAEHPVCDFKLGYHPSFDFYQDVVKNKDASFFGSISDRRRNILSKLNVVGESSITDENRINLINRTKVSLNIHYSDSALLESLRVIVFLLSNQAFVLTEDFLGDDDLKKYVVIANEHDFSSKIDYYKNNDNERNKIANEGYQYLKTERTLFQSIKKNMEKIWKI